MLSSGASTTPRRGNVVFVPPFRLTGMVVPRIGIVVPRIGRVVPRTGMVVPRLGKVDLDALLERDGSGKLVRRLTALGAGALDTSSQFVGASGVDGFAVVLPALSPASDAAASDGSVVARHFAGLYRRSSQPQQISNASAISVTPRSPIPNFDPNSDMTRLFLKRIDSTCATRTGSNNQPLNAQRRNANNVLL